MNYKIYKERALRVKIIRIAVVLSVLLALSAFAQAPIMNAEPEFTSGYYNPILWSAPTSPAGTITAWEIWVMRSDSGFPEWPTSPDSLGPPEVSTGAINLAHCTALGTTYGSDYAYELGNGYSPREADDPLTSGVRYCYKVRYRWHIDFPEENGFSEWSETYCSTQDANPPSTSVDSLTTWWNTSSVDIHYVAEDYICGGIDSVVLWYRIPPATDWEYYETVVPPAPDYDDHIYFDASSIVGDGPYEFYVAGWDSLLNGITPVGTYHAPMAFTRVDDTNPESAIETDGLETYYNGTPASVNLYFEASDVYSGVDTVHLMTDYGSSVAYSIDYAYYAGLHDFVAPDTFMFTATNNGEWNLKTMAVDSAGNYEDETGWDWTIYVDTEAPEFATVDVSDTTTVPHRFDVPAMEGWTNEADVEIVPTSANDPVMDGYASGIDSVHGASNSTFTEDVMVFDYSATPYIYTLHSGDGDKDVFLKLQDLAHNFSITKQGMIKLDTESPIISELTLYNHATPGVETDTTVSLTVDIEMELDPFYGAAMGIYFTDNPSELSSIEESEWEPLDGDYSFTFTGYSSGDWITLYAVVCDSAGNVSDSLSDDIRYISGNKWVEILSMRDIDGPDASGRYADTTLVYIDVRYANGIDTLKIWDGSSALGDPDTFFYVSDPSGEWDTVTVVGKLDHTDGWHHVAVKGKRDYDPLLTDAVVDSIELDIQRPTIPDFLVIDPTIHTEPSIPADIADTGWTNDTEVEAYFTGSADVGGDPTHNGTGLYWYRLWTDTTLLDDGSFPGTYQVSFDLPTGDNPNEILGEVQDSAGNWSSEGGGNFFTITLDTHQPTIAEVTLKDASSLSEDYTDQPTIMVQIDGDDDPYTPAYAAIFEDGSYYPDRVREMREEYGTGMLSYTLTDTTTAGLKTVYVAIMDKAGNISALAEDQIIYNKECVLQMEVYDTDDRTSTECTNSPTIGVDLSYSGTPPDAYIISETPGSPPEPDDPRWEPYPGDEDTVFTLTDVSEGTKIIYGWLLAESYIVSEMDQDTIYLDMTAPEMDEGFYVWDTTSVDIFPTTFSAAMGWSNEQYIFGQVTSAYDEGCGVDSVRFSGGIDLSLWQPLEYNADMMDSTVNLAFGVDSVPLIIDTDIEGRKDITAQLRDVAGNWGNPFDFGSEITVNGGYDITPPDFDFLDVFDEEVTDSVTSVSPTYLPLSVTDEPAPGFLWKVCWQIDGNESMTECTVYDPLWDTPTEGVFYAAFPSELASQLIPDEHYELGVVVIDSAGNPSALKTADLLILPDTIGFDFSVVDTNDTTDSDYCGEQTVMTVINIPNPPSMMRFGESETGLGAWMPYDRHGYFSFGSGSEGTKYVYAQVKFGTQESKVEVDSIILDTTNPTVADIVAFDLTSGDENYSDEKTIGFKAIGARDNSPGIIGALLVSEDPDYTVNVQKCELDLADTTTTYLASDEPYIPEDSEPSGDVRQDARVFWVKLLDRAENAAPVKTPAIVIDLDTKTLTNFPNPFNPDEQPTLIRVKGLDSGQNVEVSVYDNYGNLVYKTNTNAPSGSVAVDIVWDGKNGQGDIVAGGVYVAVVEIDGDVYKRKIAVWKSSE